MKPHFAKTRNEPATCNQALEPPSLGTCAGALSLSVDVDVLSSVKVASKVSAWPCFSKRSIESPCFSSALIEESLDIMVKLEVAILPKVRSYSPERSACHGELNQVSFKGIK